MILIKGLCTGQSILPKADVVTFTAMLKSARAPQNIRDKDNGIHALKIMDFKFLLNSLHAE